MPNPAMNIRMDPQDLGALKELAYKARMSLSDYCRSALGNHIAATEERANTEPAKPQKPIWWENPTTIKHYELRMADTRIALQKAQAKLEEAQAALDEAVILKNKTIREYTEFCEAHNV